MSDVLRVFFSLSNQGFIYAYYVYFRILECKSDIQF